MNNPEGLRIIAGWLANLAEITRHGAEGKPTKNGIATLATLLGLDFPSAAFTIASLQATAQGSEWFPAYDVIRQRVSDWWREHKPASAPALPAPAHMPQAADLTGMDRIWLNYFCKREAEGFRPSTPDGRPSNRRHCLSLIRQESQAAYAVLTAAASAEHEWRRST